MAELRTDYVAGAPRLAYDHMGDGPVLLFMHGIGSNRTSWHDQLPAFAPHFHAVAWDARGYGLSDDYADELAFSDFADDVARLLDHLGAERAHLCGLSMGGRIAQEFYPRYRDRVATLVLCDTMAGFATSLTPEQQQEFVRRRKQPLVEGKTPADIAPGLMKTLLGPGAPDDVFERAVAIMSALHPESYIKTVEASTGYDRSADLPNIGVPALLVYGEHDTLTPPAVGRGMAAQIPGSQFVEIAGAGHLSNMEKPAEFNAAVLEFLLRHRDRAAEPES